MKTQCRFCGVETEEKPMYEPKEGDSLLAMQVFGVGSILAANVCPAKMCQDELQYECDSYDQWRKGE